MSRTQDILTRVRDTLGDLDETRWTNESLLRRLNEGQYDIAKETGAFRKTYSIQIIKGQHEYVLPEDLISIKDILYAQEPLEIVGAQQMVRKYGNDWRLHTTTTDITAVVTDRQNLRQIRVYPRPFIDDLYDEAIFSPDTYGLEDAISEYTMSSDVGIIGSIYDLNLVDNNLSAFGIISDSLEGYFITVEYVRRPMKVADILEDPELPDAFDTALVRYITGTALRDDINQQNRAMGNEELILYQNELRGIAAVGKQSGTSVAHNNQSEYRGMG